MEVPWVYHGLWRARARTCSGLVVYLIVCLCVSAAAAPADRNKRIPYTDNTLRYLMSFGYLPTSDMETGNLRTDDQLKEAVKDLQTFAGLPATGEVDERTQQLLTTRRCGLPDRSEAEPSSSRGRHRRFALHSGPRWDHSDLTWSLRTHHVELDHGQVRRELHQALGVWARDSNLTFREINSEDADILVKFHKGEHGDGYAFDGPGRILAHAFFPGEERGGDVHFDEDETWLLEYQNKDDGEGTRLFMVAAHEFGHSLGLSHSSDPSSLMFPWYQTLDYNFALPDDDRHGIQTLYGAKDRWAKIPQYNPGDGRPSWRPSYRTTVRPTTPTTTLQPTTRHHYPSTDPSEPDGKPDTCDTSYDAVSVIRREVFIFKGKYMWRIGEHGLMEGYPAPITHLWRELPHDLTHVDAVYERLDKRIVFFIGRKIYLFSGNRLEHGYPQPLTSLGLPATLDHIDAATVWGYNSRTYFYSGNIYWRFDEDASHVELDYPREITTMWKGMGSHFDAVFQWKDGKTYFFKGKGFWKLNDIKMRAQDEHLTPSAPFWMNCSNFDLDFHPKKSKVGHKKWSNKEKSAFHSSSSNHLQADFCLCALMFLCYLLSR